LNRNVYFLSFVDRTHSSNFPSLLCTACQTISSRRFNVLFRQIRLHDYNLILKIATHITNSLSLLSQGKRFSCSEHRTYSSFMHSIQTIKCLFVKDVFNNIPIKIGQSRFFIIYKQIRYTGFRTISYERIYDIWYMM
jgi:hypothetical protein